MTRALLAIAVVALFLGVVTPAAAIVTPWQDAIATEYDATPPDQVNPGYPTGWNTTWGFPGDTYDPVALRFNQWTPPQPGDYLTAVEWELTGEAWGEVRMENTADNPNDITYYLQSIISLSKPGGGLITQVTPLATGTKTMQGFDGTIDFGGTSGATFNAPETPPIPATDNDFGFLFGTDMLPFEGTGTLDLPLTAGANSYGADTQGNFVIGFTTQAHAYGRVRYHWEIIPEPGTGVLMLAGLGLVGLIRRRRNA